MGRIPAGELEIVYARADGHCEACGFPLDVEAAARHHRKNRGKGGKGNLDFAENILLVHPGCHLQCHSRSDRYERGLMVHTYDDPALVPVRIVPGLCGAR